MNGVVVWVTGLPSSGKTTLANAVAERLRQRSRAVCVLDGDAVRSCLVPAPGHDDAGRDAFYTSLANLAALLAGQGLIVLVPATAHLRRYRARARAQAADFLEAQVQTSAAECARRDDKGLYAASDAGRVSSLPGRGAPYEPAAAPDFTAEGGRDAAAIERIVADLAARTPGKTTG